MGGVEEAVGQGVGQGAGESVGEGVGELGGLGVLSTRSWTAP